MGSDADDLTWLYEVAIAIESVEANHLFGCNLICVLVAQITVNELDECLSLCVCISATPTRERRKEFPRSN